MFEFFIFLYGIVIGSFLNVLIFRLPHKTFTLLTPKRSICPKCNYQLKWYENIPLFSFLFLKARCTNCKTSIPISYFLVEIISGILAVMLYLKFNISGEFFILLLLFFTLIVLSFIDFVYKAVPDYLLFIVLVIMIFTPNFNLINALIFSGGFVLLDFIITFYIQNIKARITKNKELENQKALGEGDIPIVAMIGGVLGLKLGVVAIFLAALFAIFPSIYSSIFKKEIETPFIPYLVLGFSLCFFYSQEIIKLLGSFGV
jgi:leader peptidase (prepilin peptidase)/N-methyltransferase